MYKTNEDVMNRVHEHYIELTKRIPEERIVGVFLQDSKKYDFGYEGSDVDTKAIILPTFEDFVLNKKPYSTTIVLDNDEHIDTKDIRVMFDNIKKQNINFVEILFTKYMVLNPMYQAEFQPIIDAKESVGRYNIYAALNCMAGMIMEKNKAMCHPYPATAWKIDKWGYDGKQLEHMFRVCDFMQDYVEGKSYEECLHAYNPEFQIRIKTNKEYSLDEAKTHANALLQFSKTMKDMYMNVHENTIDTTVDDVMHKVLFDILVKTFKHDIEMYQTK